MRRLTLILAVLGAAAATATAAAAGAPTTVTRLVPPPDGQAQFGFTHRLFDIVLLLVACVAALAGAAAAAPQGPAPVVAVVRHDPFVELAALEPATLRRLRSPRPLLLCCNVGALPVRPVLSADGRRLAVGLSSGTLVAVDRATLRVSRRWSALDQLADAPELAWTAGASLLFAGVGKFGLEISFPGGGALDIAGEWTRTPDGLVVLAPAVTVPFVLIPFSDEEEPEIPVEVGVAMAVDANHRRVFVVGADGTAAVVALRTHELAYHTPTPPLAHAPLEAVWAGEGRLALVSADGLTLVDTRDWSARLVSRTMTDVRGAPHALVAWNRAGSDGVTVYAPDGTVRFRALAGRTIRSVGVTAGFAYVDAGRRYSLDLHSGRLRGPLHARGRLVLPDLLALPDHRLDRDSGGG